MMMMKMLITRLSSCEEAVRRKPAKRLTRRAGLTTSSGEWRMMVTF